MFESLAAIGGMGVGVISGVFFTKMFIESELKRLGILKDNLVKHINDLEDERIEKEESYNISLTNEEMFKLYQLLSKEAVTNGDDIDEVNAKLTSKLIQYEFEKLIDDQKGV